MDYWTYLLDDIFGVTPDTRNNILSYGSEYFTDIIQGHWESNELRNLILTLQEFLREFVTCPETGDNRFATQPAFYNKNITGLGKGQKKKFLTPQKYGWPKNLHINVNKLYNMNKFISYEEFRIIYNLQFEGVPAESSFLKFKQDVSSNYGPIDSKKNTPPHFE